MCRTEELTQIVLTTTVNHSRIRIYTKLRVEPRYWDKTLQRSLPELAPNRRERMRLSAINERIEHLTSGLSSIDEQLAKDGKFLSSSAVRKVVDGVCKSAEPALPPMESLYRLVDKYAETVNRRGKRGVASTRQTYLVALKRIENFSAYEKRPITSFDDFDRRFFQDFTNYLYTYTYQRGGKEQNYTQNTIVNTLKVVKNLLHRAYDNELTDNNYFMKVQTNLPATVSEQVYLREDEIKRLMEFPLTGHEEVVRDMFVIACYTALRISDIINLREAIIQGDKLSIFQTKTKERVQIPILKEIAPLVKHYQEVGFPTFDKKSANEIIKQIACRCGIDEIITYKEQRGGVVTIKQSPKWKRISFHTARRSCITNLFRRGYPVNYIMSLSGHRSVQSCQRYIRASTAEVLDDFVGLLKRENAM